MTQCNSPQINCILKNIYMQALLLNITGNRSPVFSFFFRAALCFKVGGMNEEEEDERVLGALRSSDESPKKEEEKKDWDNGGWEGGGYQKEQGGRGGGEVHKTRRIWQVY